MGARITDPAALAESFAKANPRFGRPGSAFAACFNASVRFQMALHEGGHRDAALLRAEGTRCDHFAVLLDGTVYDLTARQFSEKAPFPWVVARPEWEDWARAELPGTVVVSVEGPVGGAG